jgi:hypothetical protein
MPANSSPFYHPNGTAGLTLTDFTIAYMDDSVTPFALLDISAVTLEDLNDTLGSGWYRLLDLPETINERTLLVGAVGELEAPLLRQTWPSTESLDYLVTLFTPVPSNIPVTMLVNDATSGLPISGANVSVWNHDSSEVVIPKLVTSVAGKVVLSLQPGDYQVYLFKSFATFTNLPINITVVAGPATTFTFTGNDAVPPVTPTINLVTVYGHVLYPNGTVAQGVEVKMRLKATPQMNQSAGFSKAFVMATTDADGYFQFVCAGGLWIMLECETVGYSRQGQLPNSGTLNWKDFAVATVTG